LEQFQDEDSAVSSTSNTLVDSWQIHSQPDAAAAAGVCMETSFGLESDEPRTHVFHGTHSEDLLNTQLRASGFLSDIFAFCIYPSLVTVAAMEDRCIFTYLYSYYSKFHIYILFKAFFPVLLSLHCENFSCSRSFAILTSFTIPFL